MLLVLLVLLWHRGQVVLLVLVLVLLWHRGQVVLLLLLECKLCCSARGTALLLLVCVAAGQLLCVFCRQSRAPLLLVLSVLLCAQLGAAAWLRWPTTCTAAFS